MTNLLMLAYDYIDNLKNTEIFNDYLTLNEKIKNEYQKEFETLSKAKKEFEEVMEYGKHHPNFKEKASTYSISSKEYYSILDVKNYLKIINLLETNINNFIKSITESISDNIPVLNELGFVVKKGGIICGS